jgi:hypothetical protein
MRRVVGGYGEGIEAVKRGYDVVLSWLGLGMKERGCGGAFEAKRRTRFVED